MLYDIFKGLKETEMKCITLTLIALSISLEVGSASFTRKAEIPFSPSNMLTIMNEVGIAYPDIVMAQAKIETGHFTSKVFRENHNLFGMKLARQRSTTAIGEQYNHAEYTSWRQSVVDYKLWQDKVLTKVKSRRAYLKYLHENYATNKQYVKLIKKMI
jgi:uncharacterized FlgJ-related protein